MKPYEERLLAGENWSDYVIDLPVILWRYYKNGRSITMADSIDRNLLRARANLKLAE